jgi:NAD(P)-dependent dehydrogenase (short-subunit alcohol dehydrogenase family)
VLVTGNSALAAGIVNGLRSRGDQVITLAPETNATRPGASIACAFGSEADVAASVAEAVDRLGGLDQVVHTHVAPGLLREQVFVEVSTDGWVTDCEASLEAAWWLMRHVAAPLRAQGGGSVVTLVPSIALAGAAGYSMLATVAEGLRVLAKGCGRQWAQYAITVNTIAAAPHHWVADDAGEALSRAISLSKPAFGHYGEADDDLAPLVAGLASPEMHFLTAGTLVADGGLWMGL